MNRYFVVGDVHGCYDKLVNLLNFWDKKEEKLIFLGDLIDRGKQSLEVLALVRRLVNEFGAIALRGNHEELLSMWIQHPHTESGLYLTQGGYETVTSFIGKELIYKYTAPFLAKYISENFRDELTFINNLPYYYHDNMYIFVYAGVDLDKANWKNTSEKDYCWIRNPFIYGKNETNHIVIFGHTPTRLLNKDKSDDVWVSPCKTKVGIDGAAVFGGKLHALRIKGKSIETLSI